MNNGSANSTVASTIIFGAGQTRDQRARAVRSWLRPIAEPVAREAEYPRWIKARAFRNDCSTDYCSDCAKNEVARLNELHPEHEYFVDGGYNREADSSPRCEECGKTLIGILTRYAIEEEVEHYASNSVALKPKLAAERAFRFMQVLESPYFDETNSETWAFFRKIERMHQRRLAKASH